MRALLRAPAVRVAFLSRLVAHSSSNKERLFDGCANEDGPMKNKQTSLELWAPEPPALQVFYCLYFDLHLVLLSYFDIFSQR